MKKVIIIGVTILILLIVIFVSTIYLLFPIKYREYVDKYSSEFGLDKKLVYSVIKIESGFDKNSVSSAGAMGLMQLLPSTAKDMASRMGIKDETIDLFDEKTNIMLGCFYLSYLLKLYENNVINTLSAYNWGLRNVNDWINKGNVDKEGNITNIPVKETSDYILKYKFSYAIYDIFYLI